MISILCCGVLFKGNDINLVELFQFKNSNNSFAEEKVVDNGNGLSQCYLTK